MKSKMMVLCLLAMGWMTSAYGQQETKGGNSRPDKTTIEFKDRWALKTNTLGWAVLMPNLGVEFDVSNSVYNKWVLAAQATWNGNAGVRPDDRIQIKLNDYRLEGRKYKKPAANKQKVGRIPKFWRTYYWGIYAGYSKYDFLWGKGIAGEAVHLGATGGYQIRLYQYKQGALDLDLGGSIGFLYTRYDKHEFQQEKMVMTESKAWKVLPFPMVTELRLGLVYRFNSIKNKYNKTKPKY